MKTLNFTQKDFIYLCIIIIIILFTLDKCNNDSNGNFGTTYNDSTKIYYNKYKEQVAVNEVLIVKNVDFLNRIKTNDAGIIELQNIVQRYKKDIKNLNSLVSIKSGTRIDTVYKTRIIKIDSIGNPTYGFEDRNKWYELRGQVNYDSTKIDIEIHNEYVIILKRKRESLFRTTPVVELINKNPYTNTTDLKSIQIENKVKSRGGIGISVGVGIGYTLKPTPYLGIGYNYILINF